MQHSPGVAAGKSAAKNCSSTCSCSWVTCKLFMRIPTTLVAVLLFPPCFKENVSRSIKSISICCKQFQFTQCNTVSLICFLHRVAIIRLPWLVRAKRRSSHRSQKAPEGQHLRAVLSQFPHVSTIFTSYICQIMSVRFNRHPILCADKSCHQITSGLWRSPTATRPLLCTVGLGVEKLSTQGLRDFWKEAIFMCNTELVHHHLFPCQSLCSKLLIAQVIIGSSTVHSFQPHQQQTMKNITRKRAIDCNITQE